MLRNELVIKLNPLSLLLLLVLSSMHHAIADQVFYPWQSENFAIEKPINGLKGDVARGKQITIDKGSCLTCHSMPIPEQSFHGTIGPPLHGIASRRSEGQIRLHIVDQTQINPATIMPGFYKNPNDLNRVLSDFSDKTMLTAQEVEDVVAYLMTLE